MAFPDCAGVHVLHKAYNFAATLALFGFFLQRVVFRFQFLFGIKVLLHIIRVIMFYVVIMQTISDHCREQQNMNWFRMDLSK